MVKSFDRRTEKEVYVCVENVWNVTINSCGIKVELYEQIFDLKVTRSCHSVSHSKSKLLGRCMRFMWPRERLLGALALSFN